MPPVKHAVITAAGIGSRLGLNLPKCLVTVAGKRIIDYQLALLKDIEDVRIVVGFHRDHVIQHVKVSRPDAIFVCNHQYASTTTLQSLYLGTRGLLEPFLSVDGDVIFEPESFRNFLGACEKTMPLTAIAPAASTDAVYAEVDSEGPLLRGLTRTPGSSWEWPGLSYLLPSMIENNPTFIYQQLEKVLPMAVCPIKCWEIDTPQDLARAEAILRNG
ncbi:MAG: NTP transferase domain-containing protein [Acidobacteria bacterium]|nr:NTP transferase domain-containing protein [Acidobacteriota bacterium]